MPAARPTFNGFAPPSSRDLIHGIRDGPVLVSDLDQPHRSLGGCVGGLQHICSSTCNGVCGGCTDNDCLCCHGSESINMCTDMDLHDVIFPQYL